MSDSTPITRARAARIAAGVDKDIREITDRLLELVPQVRAAEDESTARALLQAEFDRAGIDLREPVANMVAQLAATEH